MTLAVNLRTRPPDESGGIPVVEGEIINRGKQPVHIPSGLAGIPGLTLELRDAAGQPAPTLPPPLPDDRLLERDHSLVPGDRFPLHFASFLDVPLSAGTYRLRYRAILLGPEDPPIESDWIDFEVPRDLGFSRTPSLYARDWLPPSWLRRVSAFLACTVRRLFGLERCRRTAELELQELQRERISDAPPFPPRNGTYAWYARFHARVNQSQCRVMVTVRIRLQGSSSQAQRDAIEAAIENKWSGHFKMCCTDCCCRHGYDVLVNLEFVTVGEHYSVELVPVTTSMRHWRVDDLDNITHEFGHMLGNLEEYYTVNGIVHGPPNRRDGNVMNNSANGAAEHHYYLVRAVAERLLGSRCTTSTLGGGC